MYLSLWAIMALCLSACNGGPDSSDSPEGGSGGGNTSTPQPGEGGLNVSAVYDGQTEICQVNDENGEVLGNTEEDILGLAPGQFNFALGDPDMTTLDGQPFHVVNAWPVNNDADDDIYTVGSGAVTVITDQVIEVEVELELAPQYHCESHQCDWPYEGGTCSSLLDSEDQWIYVNSDGVLHGSEKDSFGGVSDALVVHLIDGVLTIDPHYETTDIVESSFNPVNLSFSYTFTDSDFQSSAQVNCQLD